MSTLADFLAAHPHHHETEEHWGRLGRLRVRLCLGQTLPPADVSSSVLAIVLDDDARVLVLEPSKVPLGAASIAHVVIGGRAEPGESSEQAVVREVGEETGWRIRPTRMIGFRHFHHLDARVPTTDRPYPTFVQPIYAARAAAFEPQRIIAADRIESAFVPFDDAEAYLDPGQRLLLRAAREAAFTP